MVTPLLTTKLYIPHARPRLVSRQRLIERLNAGSSRLTLVSAPAGFGKTTIISEWVRQNQPTLPASWLSLEESENEPVRFWEYFIAALRTVQAGVGETSLALLHSSEHVPIESALVPLINDVTIISKDFVLVLDDYHFVKDQIIHQGLTFFLEHMPPCIHLVITTRVDPPFPIARFRGKGMLLEIGADDLRFSLEEVTNLFA